MGLRNEIPRKVRLTLVITSLRCKGIIKNYTLQFYKTIYLSKEKSFTPEFIDVKI